MSLSHSVTESLLQSLADPEASLASVARAHNITVAALTLWLSRPEVQARVRQMESGAHTHVRLAASLNLSAAVRVLTRILDDFDALARTHPDPATRTTDPDYIRASERARKAASTLMRLSRVMPISEADLARAAVHRAANVSERTAVSHRTANVSERTAVSHRTANVSERTAVSHRTANVSERVSLSFTSPNRSPTLHSPSALNALPPTSSSKDDVDSLAASLGIDISDIDHDEPVPIEFLASLPPELAALLSEPLDPDPHESPPAPASP